MLISEAWAHGSNVGVESIGAFSPLILLLGGVVLVLFFIFVDRNKKS